MNPIQIKHREKVVGEIRRNSDGELFYLTERSNAKKQIYARKKVFVSEDGKDWMGVDENGAGISVDIIKQLLNQDVKYVIFILKGFPSPNLHSVRRISLQDFLNQSITIKEMGYDRQRIIDTAKLEVVP